MSYSPDPRKTGLTPSTRQDITDTPTVPLATPEFVGQAGGVPPNGKLPPLRPQKRGSSKRLDKRVTWLIIGGSIVLIVLLLLKFIVPLSQGIRSTIVNKVKPGTGTASAPQFIAGDYNSIQGQLFASTSPWNTNIGTNVQIDPNSSQLVSQLGSNGPHVPTMLSFGMPIYTATASDPTYTVQDGDSPFQDYQPIHIPDNAAPATGSDQWLFVYDKTKNLLFEMWQAQKNGDTWSANAAEVYSPTGDGVLQVNGQPQVGNGGSYFGGVITHADIQRGYINHALSFASQYTSPNWRYPMKASDGQGTDSFDLPMGARLQLDPSIHCSALPGASTGEKMVCKALQTYGGYIRDTGGVPLSMYFEGEDLTDPNRNPPGGSPGDAGRVGGFFGKVGLHDGKDLPDIPWDKLRVLKAWNSYTALSATPSSVNPALAALPGAQNLGTTAINTVLDLPNGAHSALWEKAKNRCWLPRM